MFAPRGTKSTGGVANDEYVVYDTRQVMVKYVVHYKTVAHDLLAKASMSGGGGATGFEIHTLTPQRKFDPDDPLDMHFRVAESRFLRSRPSMGVSRVDYVYNKSLVDRFEAKQRAFQAQGHGDMILAFHGTRKPDTIRSIITHNFDVSKIGSQTDAGYWGRGFYFSEFAGTSLVYGQNLLLCRLLPGRVFDVKGRMDGQPLRQGYNSHRLSADPHGYGQEIIIADPDQILPCYVLHVGQSGLG